MAAADRGSLDVVKLLLARGADVNAKEARGGQSALMWAVAENHPDIVRALVEGGADVRARSSGGFTPLLFAAQQGDVDSARILLDAGADVNEGTPKDGSALLIAAATGHDDLTTFLVERGADPNAVDPKGLSVLHLAAWRPDMQNSLQSLLARGADPNARLPKDIPGRGPEAISLVGATPLLLAAEVGNTAAVRLLASSGADLGVKTDKNTTPLMVAAGVGHFEDDREVLATRTGRRETARLLVELGADVNAVGENGWTALHGAAYTGSDDTISLLVEHGASIDKMDRFGQTPLSIAEGVITVGLGDDAVRRARNVRAETAALLLQLGATPVEESGVQIVIRKLQ
jgi:ankyrin repeat protein